MVIKNESHKNELINLLINFQNKCTVSADFLIFIRLSDNKSFLRALISR